MTRPTDIPQDVWNTGVKMAGEYFAWLNAGNSRGNLSEHAVAAMADTIARAILAAKAEEREACAQACESLIEAIRDEIAGEGRPVNRGNLSGQVNAVRTAVEAIRKRGEG